MNKYFNVDVIPDCIAGDVSENNGTANIGAGDILFDWTAVDVPKGSSMLRSIAAYANGEDGAIANSTSDIELVFAKSVNGVAPPSIGVTNGVQTAGGALRHHFVGFARLEGTAATGTMSKLAFGVGYMNSSTNPTGFGLPLVIDLEPISGTNVGYDTLYVAAFLVTARNYGTGVFLNESNIDASTNPTNTIIVDGVDATKIFSVGDQVYVMDLDTPIPGVLTKVEPLLLTFSETNNTVDIDEDDELLNANPIRFKFGFEK